MRWTAAVASAYARVASCLLAGGCFAGDVMAAVVAMLQRGLTESANRLFVSLLSEVLRLWGKPRSHQSMTARRPQRPTIRDSSHTGYDSVTAAASFPLSRVGFF